jgi:hypothetical protein
MSFHLTALVPAIKVKPMLPKAGHFCKAFHELETQVEKALAVLDHDSDKQLNYRQLLRHPKYKADWSRSTADKFR